MVQTRALAYVGVMLSYAAVAHAVEPDVVKVERVDGPVLSCTPAGPPPVARWAIPSRTKANSGGYVGGGGALLCGQPRCVNEGTWGWDFQGCLFLRNVWLKWNHGSLYQGGAGAYKTDGPPVPNILAVPPLPHSKTDFATAY